MRSAISCAIGAAKRVPDGIHSILERIKPVEKVNAAIKILGIRFSTIYESLRGFVGSLSLPSFLRRLRGGEANEGEFNEGSRGQSWISLRFLTSRNRASGS